MAGIESKSSFLGSVSPWSISRSTSPQPKAAQPETPKPETLRQSSGEDHAVGLTPSLSFKKYPKDCPPLKARWHYAVDAPKRKGAVSAQSTEEQAKPLPVPKKFVPFSYSDSQAVESAFRALVDDGDNHQSSDEPSNARRTRVPVNEDCLFDVDIENRELLPAYWLGPVYQVLRGTWFYQDGSVLTDEALANQLEEGYVKSAPWRTTSLQAPRSTSQTRSRPPSLILDTLNAAQNAGPAPRSPRQIQATDKPVRSEQSSANSYRLFGPYMNTTVTYQDGNVAWLTSDDFMSRMSNTVYGRLGGMIGTKVVRGYAEPGYAPELKASGPPSSYQGRRQSAAASPSAMPVGNAQEQSEKASEEAPSHPKRSALERQLSSLAGIPDAESSEDIAEEARKEEEKEMEDYRKNENDEQSRQIEHLVLVTHGIGQRLGLRLDSINFIHDVNTLRKTLKAVYANSPDLQALGPQSNDLSQNSKIQVLPICWRHLLDFPKQSVRDNKEESDLGDMGAIDEDDYPSLADITVDGVPAVRNLITDLAMDVLLYQSSYREHISRIVSQECNRVYRLFIQRNPGFSGRVSLVGHSLGSAIIFDILTRQQDTQAARHGAFSKSSKGSVVEEQDLRLDFECENFFALGSPIALFQMLKGRTIVARKKDEDLVADSPFDPVKDPFSQLKSPLPVTVSSPKCLQLFNIFHPTDPIAYRIEPLISPAMASLKPQPLPFTKKGLFATPGIANIGARVGQSASQMWYSLTSGMASSLINRSLGITGDERALPQDGVSKSASVAQAIQRDNASARDVISAVPIADDKRQQALADAAKSALAADTRPVLIDAEMLTLYENFQQRRSSKNSPSSNPLDETHNTNAAEAPERDRRIKREEAKVRALNSNGRVDYSIQEGLFDVSLLASIASHLSYWADEDVVHFMIGQMLKCNRQRQTT